MLVFLTSVRHPHNSASYQKVESLLARTLNSICSQTDQNFHVVVVCNQIPDFQAHYPKVDFVQVDFPPPSTEKTPKIEATGVKKDKGTKRLVGLLRAAQYSPEHIMFFDADDLLSNRIAEFVNARPNEHGWVVQDGYVYGDGMSLLMPKKDFHLGCGSSIILNYSLLKTLLKLPPDFPPNPSQEMILEKVDSYFLHRVLGDHSRVKGYFQETGYPLSSMPFPAAIWVVNTGENRSVDKGISGILGQPITPEVSREFTIEHRTVALPDLMEILMRLPKAVWISFRLLVFRDLKNSLYRRLSSKLWFKQLRGKMRDEVR
ncbi:MAG: glycosyltransferase family 2 protein [Leptolyngbya sp. SIO4C1]|nr:glycosyltransferase family 2 protein [Leptolyngbya sp. SIO4C1]